MTSLAHDNAPIAGCIPPEDAVRIAREANDILSAIVKEHPDRFRTMALLSMADPEAAAAELERCVKELGFVCTMLYGQYKGRFYDEPEFFPVFQKAAELDVPVYYHPAYINQGVLEHYYLSDAYSSIVGRSLAVPCSDSTSTWASMWCASSRPAPSTNCQTSRSSLAIGTRTSPPS